MKTLSDSTLKGLNKNALIKTIKELYAMRDEAIEYINIIVIAKTGFHEKEEMLNPFVRLNKTIWGEELLDILQGNKEEE